MGLAITNERPEFLLPMTSQRPSRSFFRRTLLSPRLVITATMAFSATLALAQDADEAAPPAKTWLQTWILDGGIWMFPLAVCSVLAITFTVLCLMTISKARFAPNPLRAELMDLMSQCRVRSAIETAAQSPSFLGRMMTVSLSHFDATNGETLGKEKVEDAMAEFAMVEIKPYQKWVGYFGVLSQICPMLGLMGTVIGMVQAFGILALTGGAEPSKLAGSISVALLTTLGGLMVAIPSLALFFFFKNRLNDIVADSIHAGVDLVNAATDAVHGESRAARIPEGISI